MIRVAHITPSFHPAYSYGGPTESTYQLSRFLARAGCRVRVLTTNANGADRVVPAETDRELELEAGLTVRYCARRAVHAVSPTFLAALPGYVRDADVVHLNAVYSFPTIPTFLACALAGKPIVWSTRGALQRWENVRRVRSKALWDAVCRAARPARLALHFTSVEERDQSLGRMPGATSVIIPNGVIVGEPVDHVPSETLRLLALGRLHPIKGIENLIAACAILRDRGFGPLTLTLAGSAEGDYDAVLRQRVAELSLGDRVVFAGDVRGDAKRALFENADVLVAPSFRENFGIAIAEALASGVPVIAGNATPWRELEPRGAGLWVDNGAASLADAVTRIAAMPRVEMGARGRAWVRAELSWEHAADEMIAVYERLLHSPR